MTIATIIICCLCAGELLAVIGVAIYKYFKTRKELKKRIEEDIGNDVD